MRHHIKKSLTQKLTRQLTSVKFHEKCFVQTVSLSHSELDSRTNSVDPDEAILYEMS